MRFLISLILQVDCRSAGTNPAFWKVERTNITAFFAACLFSFQPPRESRRGWAVFVDNSSSVLKHYITTPICSVSNSSPTHSTLQSTQRSFHLTGSCSLSALLLSSALLWLFPLPLKTLAPQLFETVWWTVNSFQRSSPQTSPQVYLSRYDNPNIHHNSHTDIISLQVVFLSAQGAFPVSAGTNLTIPRRLRQIILVRSSHDPSLVTGSLPKFAIYSNDTSLMSSQYLIAMVSFLSRTWLGLSNSRRRSTLMHQHPMTRISPSSFTTYQPTTWDLTTRMTTSHSSSSRTKPKQLLNTLHPTHQLHQSPTGTYYPTCYRRDESLWFLCRYTLALYKQDSANITVDSNIVPSDRTHFNLTEFANTRGDLTLIGATYFYLGPEGAIQNGPSSNASSTF